MGGELAGSASSDVRAGEWVELAGSDRIRTSGRANGGDGRANGWTQGEEARGRTSWQAQAIVE